MTDSSLRTLYSQLRHNYTPHYGGNRGTQLWAGLRQITATTRRLRSLHRRLSTCTDPAEFQRLFNDAYAEAARFRDMAAPPAPADFQALRGTPLHRKSLTQCQAELDAAKDHPFIRDIEVDGSSLWFHLISPIEIPHPFYADDDGVSPYVYQLTGGTKIRCALREYTDYLSPARFQYYNDEDNLHPHASGHEMCLGDMGNLLAQAVISFDVWGLCDLLQHWCVTYNSASPHYTLESLLGWRKCSSCRGYLPPNTPATETCGHPECTAAVCPACSGLRPVVNAPDKYCPRHRVRCGNCRAWMYSEGPAFRDTDSSIKYCSACAERFAPLSHYKIPFDIPENDKHIWRAAQQADASSEQRQALTDLSRTYMERALQTPAFTERWAALPISPLHRVSP